MIRTKPLLIVLLALCVARPSVAEDTTVRNKDFGFEVTFPQGWKDTGSVDAPAVLQFAAQTVGGAVAIIRIKFFEITDGTSLQEFYSRQKEEQAKRAPETIYVEEEELKIGSENGYKAIISVDFEKENFQYVRYFLVHQKWGYVISTATKIADFLVFSEKIDAIVQTFKLLKKE